MKSDQSDAKSVPFGGKERRETGRANGQEKKAPEIVLKEKVTLVVCGCDGDHNSR